MIRLRGSPRAAGADEEAPEYWVAYSDLLVSLLMVFALLLFLTLSQMQKDVAGVKGVMDANQGAVQIAADSAAGLGDMKVVFDPKSQSLSMPDEVLFGFGSAVLNPSTKASMSAVATGFLRHLLTNPQAAERIDAIVVEGHTDSVGTYLSNLDLSQRRAQAVMTAIVEATYGADYAPRLRELLVATGRSEIEALRAAEEGRYDAAQARRIVLRVRFRNDDLLEQIFSRLPQADAQ